MHVAPCHNKKPYGAHNGSCFVVDSVPLLFFSWFVYMYPICSNSFDKCQSSCEDQGKELFFLGKEFLNNFEPNITTYIYMYGTIVFIDRFFFFFF